MTARVAELAIYPVKAGRGRRLGAARLGSYGLDGDREWMITRLDGRFLSQRTHPAMARLEAIPAGGGLELRFPGLPPLHAAAGTEPREVRVWNDTMTAADAGAEAARWLERALGLPARLVRVSPQTRRYADRQWVGEADVALSFADGYPVLVCSSASLAALNERLDAPVPMDRFRPNLVIDGLGPFDEDRIRGVRIGAARLRFVKPCTRCSVPGIDQRTGERANDPFPALKAFRWNADLGGVTFGVNAVAEGPPGTSLEVGAPVDVEY